MSSDEPAGDRRTDARDGNDAGIAGPADPEWPWHGVLPQPLEELAAVDRLRAAGHEVYPARGLELAALSIVPFEDVRVVILGIDPYPNAEHATGLAFSVRAEVRPLPRGVRNIRAALRHDGYLQDGEPAPNGDLSDWARQGVLLLNRALTFSPVDGTYGHASIWQDYTDRIIRALDGRPRPPVFLLMGRRAQWVKRDIVRGAVVETVHPSAPGLQRDFIEAGAFRRVNALLDRPIDWSR